MQIQVYEPLTGDVLTRADVANMKLPFDHGWDSWWVTSPTGRILGRHDNYQAAELQARILPLAA
ncbi:hypothetical protein [Mesorhizobium sp. M7A.F.Ca.MR.362.00.0.0]|uniref:hypothetical protein n=1 Tax=Mesorhizobium sp. M7A.F.Ca.MR.362.00.0.0 TaxID=2496779 RepID=UPI000FD3FFB3|nr:hypothetical protein [Mesorhizobium sp. M7A.F.Ca.MR.362.00.0.0]RUU76123.1 hypothetical protein EOC06_28105 [Mesorhizobium sp. M7A.F.Ca.MR.362.00.0.0]RWN95385.1 MAG: hypothetical protein EOS05_11370 [Mesorhizobium sp.]